MSGPREENEDDENGYTVQVEYGDGVAQEIYIERDNADEDLSQVVQEVFDNDSSGYINVERN